jgi:UDP-N-acetylglucosamine 4,6-dehydratase/5-epimerase
VLNSLHVLQCGEIFVLKIPSMRITDLARVIAPDVRTLEVAIRPGEKVHEIIITADDARETVELNEVYVIQPTLSFWSYRTKHYENERSCPDGFCYSSRVNTQWVSDDEQSTKPPS